MLSLDLTQAETEQLMKAIESSLKDATYYGRYWEEKYSKSLMNKIANALLEKQRMADLLDDTEDEIFTEELF